MGANRDWKIRMRSEQCNPQLQSFFIRANHSSFWKSYLFKQCIRILQCKWTRKAVRLPQVCAWWLWLAGPMELKSSSLKVNL
ncbi:hypothetical protein Nepgr_009597 [Nepenthes gracilis]|uniref:Uncharacterized protein n=1 Tax=Nepenthes gracilis TaxID=150966 RepID=A0AAD3SBN5_NEPGR|nr:hypothetical protein Nepgr_009597 [Nepenthes gracilis]